MLRIDAEAINSILTFPKLVDTLNHAFQSHITGPPRLHFYIENPNASREKTLLMMPAWQAGKVAGIKLVTVASENSLKGLPPIQGTYRLFDVDTGTMKAMMDARSLTAKQTAAAPALASKFLSQKDSESLLTAATLAPQLIVAHASVRPLKRVYV